jgi:hypothetical protein
MQENGPSLHLNCGLFYGDSGLILFFLAEVPYTVYVRSGQIMTDPDGQKYTNSDPQHCF